MNVKAPDTHVVEELVEGRIVRPKTDEEKVRPDHYGGADNPYEVIKVMLAWYGVEETVSFCKLNAMKYLARAGKKEGQARGIDFRKAAWYARAAASLLELGELPDE